MADCLRCWRCWSRCSADLLQLTLEKGNAPADLAAVDFQLGFARVRGPRRRLSAPPARPPAWRARWVQARVSRGQAVFVLGQLHLHGAFAGAGVAGKNVQNEGGTVDDFDLLAERLFQFALLARRKLLVENHDVGTQLGDQHVDLFQLARADQGRRVRPFQTLREAADNDQVGGFSEQRQFIEGILQRKRRGFALDLYADQYAVFDGRGGEDQSLVVAQDRLVRARFAGGGVSGVGSILIGHRRYFSNRSIWARTSEGNGALRFSR